MSDKDKCIRERRVNWGDDFNNRKEVFEIFGTPEMESGYLGRRDWFKIPGLKKVVCLLKGNEGRNGWRNYFGWGERTDSRGWNEVTAFKSVNELDSGKSEKFMDAMMNGDDDVEFYVFQKFFWRGESWYKFMGVFGFDRRSTYLFGGQPLTMAMMDLWDGRFFTFFKRNGESGIVV